MYVTNSSKCKIVGKMILIWVKFISCKIFHYLASAKLDTWKIHFFFMQPEFDTRPNLTTFKLQLLR